MLSKRILLACFLPVVILSTNLHAAPKLKPQTIKVGTGSKSGNYYAMAEDIRNYCEEDLTQGSVFLPQTSDGSVDNILGMGNKQFSAAVVQEDVLQYFSKTQPRKVNTNRMKIISGLHMESVHLLVPKGYKGDQGNGLKNMLGSLFNNKTQKQFLLACSKDKPSVPGAAASLVQKLSVSLCS